MTELNQTSKKKQKTAIVNKSDSETVNNESESKAVEQSNVSTKKSAMEVADSLPKSSMLWLKDSNGKPSVSATFATVAFWVTTLAYVFSIFEGYGQVSFRQFDVAACSAYLIPILTLYFSRRWSTDRLNIIQRQNETSKSNSSGDEND
jgi:hypothetical protein